MLTIGNKQWGSVPALPLTNFRLGGQGVFVALFMDRPHAPIHESSDQADQTSLSFICIRMDSVNKWMGWHAPYLVP